MSQETLIAFGFLTVWAGGTVVNIMLHFKTSLGEADRPLRIIAVLMVGAVYAGFVLCRMVWPDAQFFLLFVAVVLMWIIQLGQRWISSIWIWLKRWQEQRDKIKPGKSG